MRSQLDNFDDNNQYGLFCADVSLTQQSQLQDTDINVIMERALRTGVVPVSRQAPSYGDFRGITDFRTAMEVVSAAEETFMGLPAAFRARMENDAQRFLAFCEDPGNLPEMAQLGLVPPVEVQEPAKPAVDGAVAPGAPKAA